ncbi:MAG: guanylate cyclase, partial [Treponema sp.]|nr:guanylate cyclase [Treponema sp.]
MSKKIVILEPSATLQKLFATTLDGDEYGIQFATDGKEAIYMLLESVPDLFLLNAELDNPGSYEVVRIVRSISCLKGLSVGMYATTPFPFDEELAQNCGADVFLLMDKNTMSMSVAELVQISGLRVDRLAVVQARKEIDDGVLFKNAVKILRSDSFRSMILTRIIQIFDIIESVEDV